MAKSGCTYQLLEDAVVQLHLRLPAFEEVVVIVLQALPMGIELLQAVGVDVLDPISSINTQDCANLDDDCHIHTCRTPCDFPPFFQALKLPSAVGLGLALHVIVIVRATAIADEI